MRKKSFDCVEMMHEAGRRVSLMLRAMTPEERSEYWRRETEAMRRRQAELRAQAEARGGAEVEPTDSGPVRTPPVWPREMTAEEEAAYLAERMEELRKFAARMPAATGKR